MILEHDWSVRDRGTLDDLFSATYEELRRLASSVRRNASATLSPTALVNEAWLKLADSPAVANTSPAALQADRRARHAAGAGRSGAPPEGRQARRRVAVVTFDDAMRAVTTADDVLGLGRRSRGTGARSKPRQALMVESRFFGGLDVRKRRRCSRSPRRRCCATGARRRRGWPASSGDRHERLALGTNPDGLSPRRRSARARSGGST